MLKLELEHPNIEAGHVYLLLEAARRLLGEDARFYSLETRTHHGAPAGALTRRELLSGTGIVQTSSGDALKRHTISYRGLLEGSADVLARELPRLIDYSGEK